jgi:predicted dithiol-disulfide oxidoreductase (DUF899 family)
MEKPRVASREEWLKERRALLQREKAHTRERDAIAEERRELPWVKVEKDYVFEGPEGKVGLSDLFGGKSQLFVKHFMKGPGQVAQCVGCSLEVDHVDGILVHLQNHDLAYVAVARAPIAEIEEYRKRMGWRFRWVSSHGSDFNYDFHVSFTPEQVAAGRAFVNFDDGTPWGEDMSGDSVFVKDEKGQIFHTYSTYLRGGEEFLGLYRYIDATPKGRIETGPTGTLGDWVRPHDMYGKGGMVERNGRYHLAACACSAHAMP